MGDEGLRNAARGLRQSLSGKGRGTVQLLAINYQLPIELLWLLLLTANDCLTTAPVIPFHVLYKGVLSKMLATVAITTWNSLQVQCFATKKALGISVASISLQLLRKAELHLNLKSPYPKYIL